MKTTMRLQKGFTLIELLVVIGILGILAASLIATIDPFEQLRKGNDATRKNTVAEFVNANIRYYTTHSAMPWDNATVGGGGCNANTAPSFMALNASAMTVANTGCLSLLIADGELKSGFTSATGILGDIFVTGGTNSVIACFDPESKSQDRDPNTKYSSVGVETTGCVSQTANGSTSCYWCTQ